MKQDKQKAQKSFSLKNLRNVTIQGISYHIFLRHFPVVMMVLFFSMWYISSRYDSVTAVETVAKLNRELEIARTHTQSERSEYMSHTRESAMKKMVDSLNLGLSIQQQPPYKLSLK